VFDFGGGNILTLRDVATTDLVAGDFVFLGPPPPPPGMTINGTKFADVIDATTSPTGQPRPTGLSDTINGLGGNDTIVALGGNDTVNGGAGNDTIDAGDGDDTIVIAGTEAQFDIMSGGTGFDTLVLSGSKVTLAGFDAAAASIEAVQAKNATILGNAGGNLLDFSTLQSVTGLAAIDGGNGNDTLTGSQFADTMRGGNGNDTLTGNGGNDILTGGKNIDTFIFGSGFGHDRITDFAVKGTMQDIIQFDSAVFADFASVMAKASQVGKAVVITVDANNSLTLDKVTLASLNAGDFLFA
ncbi:MAG: calcium-binding protein, partial [Pseudorhodoplanes sp.]